MAGIDFWTVQYACLGIDWLSHAFDIFNTCAVVVVVVVVVMLSFVDKRFVCCISTVKWSYFCMCFG